MRQVSGVKMQRQLAFPLIFFYLFWGAFPGTCNQMSFNIRSDILFSTSASNAIWHRFNCTGAPEPSAQGALGYPILTLPLCSENPVFSLKDEYTNNSWYGDMGQTLGGHQGYRWCSEDLMGQGTKFGSSYVYPFSSLLFLFIFKLGPMMIKEQAWEVWRIQNAED